MTKTDNGVWVRVMMTYFSRKEWGLFYILVGFLVNEMDMRPSNRTFISLVRVLGLRINESVSLYTSDGVEKKCQINKQLCFWKTWIVNTSARWVHSGVMDIVMYAPCKVSIKLVMAYQFLYHMRFSYSKQGFNWNYVNSSHS